jgi:hypothetical protein
MAINPGYFKSGEVANPAGRPKGSRNKRTQEIWNTLETRGDLDPAEHLSSIVSDKQASPELRAAAANFLLPYKYSKCGSIIPPRYIEEPIDLPRPTSLEIANANIALISELKAQGRIDLDFANSLIADNRTIADNLIAEEELKLKLAASPGHQPEQRIIIGGGLPPLPGCDVIMPQLNGVSGHGMELLTKTLDLEKNAGTTLAAPDADPEITEPESLVPVSPAQDQQP